MLEILGQDFWNAEVLGVSPQVRVEPGKLIGSDTAQSHADKGGSLGEKLYVGIQAGNIIAIEF